MDSSPIITFVLTAVVAIAALGVIYLLLVTRRHPSLNVQRFQTKWLEIENSVSRDNQASWQLAILNADKLVDQALKERKFKGSTMGERMKSAQNTWKNANHIWAAHKVRNQLAHDIDARLNYDLTLRSLSAFKQALKDLGAI